MKQIRTFIFSVFFASLVFVACNTGAPKVAGADTTATSNIAFPYTPNYNSNWSYDVSDADLLTVLNSYKDWENGDLTALRSTLADSVSWTSNFGLQFDGTADSLIKFWQPHRDSLSSVSISMDAWVKNHSLKDSADYITVWYKEIDTYKTGHVDSANFADINHVEGGKVAWIGQYRQELKK
jgi:hypothetical protein